MSDGDSEVDFFDLTDDDNRLESDDETLPPLELTLMLDEDGQGVYHTIEPPQAIDPTDMDTDDTLHDNGNDDEVDQPVEGSPEDPDEYDPDDDGFNDDDESEEEKARFKPMNPDAALVEALGADSIPIPNWDGSCFQTCQPPWNMLADKYTGWRQLFLTKRAELQNCKRVNKKKVTRLNREIRAMKEAIHEFYAVHTENNAKNARLAEENRALRALLSDEDLANFPEPKPQDLEDIVACLPERVLTKLPDDIQEYLTKGPRHVLPAPKLRKTEREWPAVAEEFLETGPNAVYQDWGDVYKLSCREENMSWAFGESRAPKTHPYLKLVPPTSSQEQSAIAGVSDCCTPPPIPRDCDSSSSDEEQGFQPFRFQDLPRKIQLKIFRWVLVFEGEAIHAISRLDPYYEPGSMHLNCNRQHIELLWMGSQRLTYELDEKGKYTSRRTHDLAYLPAASRLKTIAVHIPESSKSYMRRKHEPPKIIEYLEEITRDQPNYRLFRELRSLQGLDYVCCLRGLREVTFWDYDRWLNEEAKMPVRDWTFVRDINDCVRREKSHNNEHFSQIRYLAPVMKGCRPSIALAARLEAFVNPPPRPAGLLTLSPDGELLYPQPQASVNHLIVLYDSDDEDHPDTDDTGEAEASSNEGSGDEGSGDESDADDSPDHDDGGDADGVVANGNLETIDISDDEADDEDDDHGEAGDVAPETTNTTEADRVAMPPPTAPVRANSRGQETSPPLFMQSATPESPRPMFVQKLETPSSPGASSHTEGTPARAKREESSLFVGSPLHGGRDSPIDMTQDADMPSPEGQNKRSFASYSTVDENDECLYMGSSPKRAKTEEDDGVDGGSGSGNAANASSGPFIINDDD
ncbi:unnamed protein product [Fusarium graminearum]|nr:hypothetical protein HG531_005366 [Fusarium graminearum]CAG1987089.1 unnamed protein product [Fusarium graminearum]CAG1987766.1 unnamed protein product [Fusarium graminearum]